MADEDTTTQQEENPPAPTPEEQLEATRKAQFGVFYGAKVTSDLLANTVSATVDDTLPGKSKISVTLDMALAGWMVFEEVARQLNAQSDTLRKERSLE